MQSHANDYWEHKSTADFLSFGNDQRPSPAKSGSDIFGKRFQEQMLPEKREQARSGGGRLLYFRWKSFCLHFKHACAFFPNAGLTLEPSPMALQDTSLGGWKSVCCPPSSPGCTAVSPVTVTLPDVHRQNFNHRQYIFPHIHQERLLRSLKKNPWEPNFIKGEKRF